MKFSFRGVRFQVWVYFVLFAIGILALFGSLQNILISPYYRNAKIDTIQNVVNVIQDKMIDNSYINSSDVDSVAQLAIDNNVCTLVYNDKGDIVYRSDGLGASCIFNQGFTLQNESYRALNSSNSLQELLITSGGEISEVFSHSKSNQEMILYGRYVEANLENYTIYVNSPVELLDSTLQVFRTQFSILSVALLILSVAMSFILSSRIARPITSMTIPANELASGNYGIHFTGGHFNELDELANTLNTATSKLSKVDELRKDLIANVSHDIKTPLTMIKAYAEMIKDISGDDKEKREEHLDIIIKEVDYLNRLVLDMAELSKLQSGNIELSLSQFDIVEKTNEIVSICEGLFNEHNLTCVVDAPETALVSADEVKIGQVIYNFLSNAIKHSNDGGKIDIIITDRKGIVKVMVQDNGVGIKQEDLPYIWNRYYKIDKGFNRNTAGSGLGLAIVKAILDTHHATYGVVSEEGEGSTFWFELIKEDAT